MTNNLQVYPEHLSNMITDYINLNNGEYTGHEDTNSVITDLKRKYGTKNQQLNEFIRMIDYQAEKLSYSMDGKNIYMEYTTGFYVIEDTTNTKITELSKTIYERMDAIYGGLTDDIFSKKTEIIINNSTRKFIKYVIMTASEAIEMIENNIIEHIQNNLTQLPDGTFCCSFSIFSDDEFEEYNERWRMNVNSVDFPVLYPNLFLTFDNENDINEIKKQHLKKKLKR